MKSIIIACETIQDEVMMAIDKTGIKYPVVWIESGLHNYPEVLRDKLQDQINKITNVDKIYLAFGYCGNALLGVYSKEAKLIVPKVDDCISLLLGSCRIRQELAKEAGTYFLTRGWIEHENNIIKEYIRCIEKYGKERADKVIKMMLEHYKYLTLIDTGAYSTIDYLDCSQSFAKNFGLEHRVVSGSINFLKKLFTGPWDQDFIIVKPKETITIESFRNIVEPGAKLSQ